MVDDLFVVEEKIGVLSSVHQDLVVCVEEFEYLKGSQTFLSDVEVS